MKTSWGVRILVIVLTFLAVLSGYNYFFQPAANSPWFGVPGKPEVQVTPSPVQGDDQLVNSLSSREKILQILAVPVTVGVGSTTTPGEIPQSTLDWLSANQPGTVVVFGTNISTTSAQLMQKQLVTAYASAQLEPLVAVDHEGGAVSRFSGPGFTKLESWREQCQNDPYESLSALTQSAQELAAVGVDVVFAPVVDLAVASSPLQDRACSSQASLIIERSLDYVRAFQKEGILPVLKHFPGIGKATKDLHVSFDRVEVDTEDVRTYRTILDTYPTIGVMMSHAGITNQYADIPCSLSPTCVNELLSYYPQALVFTDAVEMKAAAYNESDPEQPKNLAQIVKEAILAGNTIVVFGKDSNLEQLDEILQALEQEYDHSASFSAKVDESVAKIIEYKHNRAGTP